MPRIRGAFLGLDHATDRAAADPRGAGGRGLCVPRLPRRAGRDRDPNRPRCWPSAAARGRDYWLHAIATALDMPVDLPVAGDFGARLRRGAAGA